MKKPKYTFTRCKTEAERKERTRERKRRWAQEHYAENYERLKKWRKRQK